MNMLWQDKRLKVKAWMSPPTYKVTPDTLVDDAFRLMRDRQIRHLLVMEAGALAGVVTDRDLRHPGRPGRPFTVSELYLVGRNLTVLGLMSTQVVTVDEDDSTAFASRLMIHHQIGCLPVMRNGEVVGIVTSTDLMRALAYAVDPEAAWEAESASA
jgi:acetoin utilization protein AcuB